MRIAVVTLSDAGAAVAARVAEAFPGAELWVHESAAALPGAGRFARTADLMVELFERCRGVVCVMPCGVAVRAVTPLLRHKTEDPAVVVVDVLGRWAVSLLSGHEGGANDLTLRVANRLGAEPVITTTSEAARTVIVGVGCRRGIGADAVEGAVLAALARAGADLSEVRLLASADLKEDEAGLLEAAKRLALPVRFLPSEEIRRSAREFAHSAFVDEKVGLPAVAEPAALLAGRRTTLVLPKQVFDGVTVAVARESSTW